MSIGGSFGYGLALQDKWPQGNYSRDSYLYGQRQKAAKAKKEAGDEEDYQKYLSSININTDKVDPFYRPDVEAATAKLLSKAEALKASGSATWRNQLPQEVFKTKQEIQKYIALSDELNDLKKIPREQLTLPQRQVLDAVRTGHKEELAKVPADRMGSYSVGDDSRISFPYKLPVKPDIQMQASKLLDQANKSNVSQLYDLNQRFPGAKFSYLEGKTMPETESDARDAEDKIYKETGQRITLESKESALKMFYNATPDVQAWYGELNRPRYEKDQTLDFNDPNSTHARISQDFFNEMKGLGGQSYKAKLGSIPTSLSTKNIVVTPLSPEQGQSPPLMMIGVDHPLVNQKSLTGLAMSGSLEKLFPSGREVPIASDKFIPIPNIEVGLTPNKEFSFADGKTHAVAGARDYIVSGAARSSYIENKNGDYQLLPQTYFSLDKSEKDMVDKYLESKGYGKPKSGYFIMANQKPTSESEAVSYTEGEPNVSMRSSSQVNYPRAIKMSRAAYEQIKNSFKAKGKNFEIKGADDLFGNNSQPVKNDPLGIF